MIPKFVSERLEPVRELLVRVRQPLEPKRPIFEPLRQLLEGVRHPLEPEPLMFEPVRRLLEVIRQLLGPTRNYLGSARQFFEPLRRIASRSLRADHVAGAAFIAFAFVILAFSRELPIGRLSMPGAGFLPNVIAWLLILFGVLLVLRASQESAPLVKIDWADLWHAVPVIVTTGIAIFLYTRLGFILTMVLMMLGLLVLVERRNIFDAGVYGVVVVMLAFGLFHTFLRAPLPTGPFGF